ncbi:Tap42 interacting protein [Cryptotrichosporon argae]
MATAPAHMLLPAELGPTYTVTQKAGTTTVKIGEWTIEATSRPILSGKEADALEKELGLPLPEIVFGNNALVLTHTPASGSTNPSDAAESTTIRFDARGALGRVAIGEGWEQRVGGGVLVSAAEAWGKSRSTSSALSDVPMSTKPVRPHDWTYSTIYAGDVAGPSTFRESPMHALPLALLARRDPVADRILHYDDIILFEDELHDFGDSTLNVRIRVMPHSFFVLSRLFVRVDAVLFRIFDVRLFHAFGTGEVVRETAGLEADYNRVRACLEQGDDLTPLTDQNWVYGVMGQLPPGKSKGKPWPGLGKKVEVLRLAGTAGAMEALSLGD